MIFSFTDTAATIRRLATYAGSKAERATVAGSVYGMFSPIDSDANTIALNMVGQAYTFICGGDTDIRERDELTINSATYTVKGIQLYDRISICTKICYLEKNK